LKQYGINLLYPLFCLKYVFDRKKVLFLTKLIRKLRNNWIQVTEYTEEGRPTFTHLGICGNSTGFVQTQYTLVEFLVSWGT